MKLISKLFSLKKTMLISSLINLKLPIIVLPSENFERQKISLG